MIHLLQVGVIAADAGLRQLIVAALRRCGVPPVFAVSGTADELYKVESSNPNVLILDFGRPDAIAAAAELVAAKRGRAIIGAHTVGDSDVILAAIRAGAREFLYPPIDDQALSNALTAIAAELSAPSDGPRRKATAVGFLSASGGCGATTVACHFSGALRGLALGKVLVADFDLAAGMAAFWFRAKSEYSVVHAAQNLKRMDRNFWRHLVSEGRPDLDVMAAPTEIPLRNPPDFRQFAAVLRFARGNYDWIIADLGQGLTELSLELLSELDQVFVVSSGDFTALYQTRRITRALLDAGCSPSALRVILSRVRKDQDLSDSARLVGVPVVLALPALDTEMEEAHAEGRLLPPRSEFARRIARLAAEVGGVTPPPEGQSRFASLLRSFLPETG